MPSASSLLYADILKKQFSLSSTTPKPDASTNRPPRKQKAALIDYDSNNDKGATAATAESHQMAPNLVTTPTVDYAAEMQLIKQELANLCTLITSAVEQMKSATDSLTSSHPTSTRVMDIATDMPKDTNHPHHPNNLPTELNDLVTNLKYEIATIVMETRALFKKSKNSMMTNYQPPPPAT